MKSEEFLKERKEGEGRMEPSSVWGFRKGNRENSSLQFLLKWESSAIPLRRDVQNAQGDPGSVEYFCGGSSWEWFLLPQP